MSKPSGTNYPKTFRWYFFQVHVFSCMSCPSSQNHYFWWLWSGCSPLPIPNREVKPRIADDTALVCGKVGRRQSFLRSSIRNSFFFLIITFCATTNCNCTFAKWLRNVQSHFARSHESISRYCAVSCVGRGYRLSCTPYLIHSYCG